MSYIYTNTKPVPAEEPEIPPINLDAMIDEATATAARLDGILDRIEAREDDAQ